MAWWNKLSAPKSTNHAKKVYWIIECPPLKKMLINIKAPKEEAMSMDLTTDLFFTSNIIIASLIILSVNIWKTRKKKVWIGHSLHQKLLRKRIK